MFSFWQFVSIFLSSTCIFLKKLWGVWEIANVTGNKASTLPAPSVKRKEKRPSDTLRGWWSLAGRWEQNKWLQGNLLPEHTGERLIYTPSHKSLYPFQKAFCFAFPTASFLPFNSACARAPFPWESCSQHEGSIPFPLLFPDSSQPQQLQGLGVPCHRTLIWPILCVMWFPFISLTPWATHPTPSGTTISPQFPLPVSSPHPLFHKKAIFKVPFLPTLPLYLSICFLNLFFGVFFLFFLPFHAYFPCSRLSVL